MGWNYSNIFSGNLRVRWTKTEKNEEFEGVADSLNAVNQNILEFFLLPFEYVPVKTAASKIWLGIGGYFYNEILKEKGFFNMSELEVLGKETVNSYTNEFRMWTLGPVLDLGYTFHGWEWLNVSVSAGVVPIFATWAKQNVSIVPLLGTDKAEYSQSHSGSPYLYADLSGMISLPGRSLNPSNWKLWFSLLYDYSNLRYELLDFKFDGSDFNWYNRETTVRYQSFKIEGALLIPIGGMHLQIGGGRVFDSMTFDSGPAVDRGRNYLNIAGKIIGL